MKKDMSEQEMNSYRFTSGTDPSDEMLTQLMKEVAHDVKVRSEKANAEYFASMRHNAEEKREMGRSNPRSYKWINQSINPN